MSKNVTAELEREIWNRADELEISGLRKKKKKKKAVRVLFQKIKKLHNLI